ncbi:MAG: oxygenase MpaB family protein [Crocosphaera sp.]
MYWFNGDRLKQIQQLNPETDYNLICHLLVGYEYPWDIARSFELAMFKTFCVPSISNLLDRTGEVHHHAQKRHDDAGLLIAEFFKWGIDHERSQESIRRINEMHKHYPISNDDYLYILSTFIYEPIRWNERFGWRPFCETEKLAIFYFWRNIGQKMYIKDIPSDYEKFYQYNQNYEQQYFVYSQSNYHVAQSTINLFLSWFPAFSRRMLKPCIYSLFDESTLTALGLEKPPTIISQLVKNSLKLRGYLRRLSLPRKTSEFLTDSPLRTYPNGYELSDLGPTKMLSKLNEKTPI